MPIAPPPTRAAAVEANVFWLRFQKEIAAALIVAVLAMVGYAGYRFYVNHRDASAADLLGNAKSAEDYQAVIARYPGTPAGGSAYLLLAEKQRNEKKFADSNSTLQAFIEKNPEHELGPIAQLTMAANLQAMPVQDGAGVGIQPATLSTYRIGGDGKLTYVRSYDIQTNGLTQFWSGFARL